MNQLNSSGTKRKMANAQHESKEDLLKRFKAERVAREKARIQMLHDLNRKKYSKNDENSWRYWKSNTSLNISTEKSPVKNAIAMKKRGPIFVKDINNQIKKPRVKNYYQLHSSFSDNCLNVSAPVCSNASFSEDLAKKRKSLHNTTAVEYKSTDCSSTSTRDLE